MGRMLIEYVPSYVVYDLETTGVSCNTDRITEIGAVKVVDGAIVGEFSTFVNPETPIPWQVTNVTGITDDMVADAPLISEAIADFAEFIGDCVLVGHNIQTFDNKFIDREMRDCLGRGLENDFVDTLKLARVMFPQMEHHRLTDMAYHYGISVHGAHRAINDVRMNQQVYKKLGRELAGNKNIRKCPRCGDLLKRRSGKFGEFWGCSGYPDCRYTENVQADLHK